MGKMEKKRKRADRWIYKNWKEGEHSYRRTRLWPGWLKGYIMPNWSHLVDKQCSSRTREGDRDVETIHVQEDNH